MNSLVIVLLAVCVLMTTATPILRENSEDTLQDSTAPRVKRQFPGMGYGMGMMPGMGYGMGMPGMGMGGMGGMGGGGMGMFPGIATGNSQRWNRYMSVRTGGSNSNNQFAMLG